MVTKTLAYDAPAYHVPIVFSGSTEKVANGVTPKWIAFTAMKLKRVIQAPVLALITTAAGSQPFLYTQSGTTTSTTTLTVLTSASYAAVENDISDVTLAAGDRFWVTHGTDAAVSNAVSVEASIIPGSTLAE